MKNKMIEIKTPWIAPEEPTIQVHQWLVAEGDAVEIDQDILALLVDGEAFILPSPVDGIVSQIMVETGDLIISDQVLAIVEI